MLVLERRRDQDILITLADGRVVVLTVVEVHRGSVRLGIKGSLAIPARRAEVQRRVDRERLAAAAVRPIAPRGGD
jgi:carbon storage regulator